ncbi:cytochrome P450 [Rhizopus microsporus var. microsporus]|uniref:NADPH--hemoprotein reductase n=2 Tax=Rhizopus microsporus TaxID=58291 RepID=A0A2G4T3F0_RHIZD|nr:cytochrome P450 [Rhizopus microsporus ATCC 52813]ORE06120.1 cytochrome P450 [Rhizopus microsporus var. microsporus]PHZ15552.1 cytochrome P450 [Rhizopus microsporus ATCC 52813]
MSTDNTTSLIIALRGAQDIETEGRIIRFGNGANLDTVRSLAAEKLSIAGGYANLQLLNAKGELLGGIDDVRNQQVVYIDIKEQIREIIPGPTKLPFVGSLYEMLPNLTEGWIRQFKTYGPVVEVSLLGKSIVGTNDPVIAEIFAKESEFFTKKITKAGLGEVKEFAGQGLFTTDTDEMDWQLAHKLLMPAFSPRAIKAYQPEMGIITQQTIKVFEQYRSDEPVEILDWTTNLTFETIGRIGFGYEFNLLEGRDQKPNEFIEAMGYCLRQALQRVQQAEFVKSLPIEANRRFDRSVRLMHEVVENVIRERKSSPDATNKEKDLLGFMLNARDEHNLGLSDENIRDQVVTFLIAGHDTTANTLAWTLYELAKNPDIQAKVLQEIADNHISHDELPTPEQISNLKYMHQVLKETLRKYPPVRALSKYCKKECILPGGYKIKSGQPCSIQVYGMHHNENVYPEPDRFDPDRWTPEEEQKRSRFAWLPFSTGPRACIGMAFALQEAKTVLAMLLHRFDFKHDGSEVQYDFKMATTKPHELFMTIHPRENFPQPSGNASPKRAAAPTEPTKRVNMPVASNEGKIETELPPITFLYGTQTGTAQDYASILADQAKNFGFKKVTVSEMDKWKVLADGKFISDDKNTRKLDKELVVVCTATYNGQPPDNAEKFDKFLEDKTRESDHENLLTGLSYTVFGLGNKNWRTYQYFPIKVNRCLSELGAERIFASGEGDADKDMDAAFNEWCAHFWSHVLDMYGIAPSESKSVVPSAVSKESTVDITFIKPTDKEHWEAGINNRYGNTNAIVHVNHELQKENSPRSTRHIEIDISKLSPIGEDGKLYSPGDHLEVMPENNQATVEAIALNFNWVLDSVFEINQETLSDVSPRSLAANIKGPCTIRNMLRYYADVTSPPSRAVLGCFAAQLKLVAPETASEFEKLVMPDANNQDQYPDFIKKHRTLLDLIYAYPQVNRLDLRQFLAAVPVIQPRRYSIASSPLTYPQSAHLTVGVVDDVVNDRHYPGLSSSFLKSANNLAIRATLKSSKNTFSLPEDPLTPIIMIAAGTGFAPFRGFLQERKAQMEKLGADKVAPSVLFFGCRRVDQDYIYQEELENYVKDGVLSHLHVAFSRSEQKSPIKYVQHQILANATEVWNLLLPTDGKTKPAAIYICGSGAMSRDVRRTFCNMAVSFGVTSSEEDAQTLIGKLMDQKRYNEDVWG